MEITDETCQAIFKALDYQFGDEMDHFIELDDNGEDVSDHIYRDFYAAMVGLGVDVTHSRDPNETQDAYEERQLRFPENEHLRHCIEREERLKQK